MKMEWQETANIITVTNSTVRYYTTDWGFILKHWKLKESERINDISSSKITSTQTKSSKSI